jgi:transcription-repair coupling factor (superfamily II helicase)
LHRGPRYNSSYANPHVDPVRIIELIQKDRNLKFAGPEKLIWKRDTATLSERALAVRELFRRLKP